MRKCLVLAAMALWASNAWAQDARGLWQTEMTSEGALEIRISSCGSVLCGVIETARTPDGSAAEYPHLGKQMIWDMMADGAASWSNGKIWDPRNDRTFNSKMALNGNSLSVSGCFLGICQRQTWTRIK